MEKASDMLVAIPEGPEGGRRGAGSGGRSSSPPTSLQRPPRLRRSHSNEGPPPPPPLPPPLEPGDKRNGDLEENLGSFQTMEINSSYSHLAKKDLTGTSPLSSPVISRRTDLNNLTNSLHFDPMFHEQAFQQQIRQLKQQQQLEQRILLERYQAQRQQIDEHHEKQIQQRLQSIQEVETPLDGALTERELFYAHLPGAAGFHLTNKEYWENKKKLEREEREKQEKEKLEALKNKETHEQSAVASSEVKQKLQGFLLGKKQREAAAAAAAAAAASAAAGANGTSNVAAAGFRNWHPLLAKYDDDFPLRKTASEPNLLKVRLKQRVIDRRSSPMMRRKDRPMAPVKRKSQLAIDTASSTPDSGPNSPPNGASIPTSRSSSGSTPIQEEGSSSPYGTLAGGQGSISDLTLYSSPSMPNISLGRPPMHSGSGDGSKLPTVSEAAFSARLGMPLSSQVLHGTMPFYHSLTAMDPEYSGPTSPAFIHKQMQALEQAASGSRVGIHALYPMGGPITDAQAAQVRLGKSGHRPLGRTQSAPLPLGHPMLQGAGVGAVAPGVGAAAAAAASVAAAAAFGPQQYGEYLREKQQYEQQQVHHFLRQQIRQTVLTRASSKNHVAGPTGPAGTEEEEVARQQHQEMLNAHQQQHQPEVIDLTDRSKQQESEMARQQREREQFLQQQRDLMMRHTLQVSESSAFTPRVAHMARPLSRALSSPLVTLSPTGSPQEPAMHSSGKLGFGTGVAFDSLMLKHQCICGDNSNHPEHGGRLQSIWARLQETGLVQRCEKIRSRKATLEEIQSCHSEAHTLLFGTNPLNRQKLDMSKFAELPIKSFVRLPCMGIGVDSDTTWNELHTASAARMAVGCVVELAFKVATGEIKNGFGVVRPPGHHAEHSQAMGFCFFNSVAIAAKQLRQRLKLEKILVVDWDVHHGNGTQQMFYDDPHTLYLSVHRHDDGNFFPGTGAPTECGNEDGIGFTVNVAWSGGLNPPMGDAEYLAVLRSIIMPIARDFDPDIVLVSSGFDAAAGHAAPLGGYKVTAACFGYMTRQLMQLAGGKVVLVLEGGYDLPAICDASQECVKALLGDDLVPIREEELRRQPCLNAVETLRGTLAAQAPHWPCIKRYAHLAACSALEATQREREESDTVSAMASLSMQHQAAAAAAIHASNCQQGPLEEPMDQDEGK